MKRIFIILLILLLIYGCKNKEDDVLYWDSVEVLEEEPENETLEEPEVEIEEVPEVVVEEEPEEEYESPEIDNYLLEVDCVTGLSVVGKITGSVQSIDLDIMQGKFLMTSGTSNFIDSSGWYSYSNTELEEEVYDYELVVTTPDDKRYILKKGTFNITKCSVVSSTSPEDGAEDVSINADIEINFIKAMDEESVEDAIETSFTFTASWEGNTLTLEPSELEYDTKYVIDITTDAMDKEGNEIEDPYKFSFTTRSVPSPVVDDFTIEKLHDDDDDNPYMYEFEIDVSNPDDLTPLELEWDIDCGDFYNNSINIGSNFDGTEDRIEWWFNTTNEDCDDAELTITITNTEGEETVYTKLVLE